MVLSSMVSIVVIISISPSVIPFHNLECLSTEILLPSYFTLGWPIISYLWGECSHGNDDASLTRIVSVTTLKTRTYDRHPLNEPTHLKTYFFISQMKRRQLLRKSYKSSRKMKQCPIERCRSKPQVKLSNHLTYKHPDLSKAEREEALRKAKAVPAKDTKKGRPRHCRPVASVACCAGEVAATDQV